MVSDLSGSTAAITWVKTLIPFGFVIMIPALMTVGISGFRLGKTNRGALVERKRKRTLIIAATGIAILIPSALYLSCKAEPRTFDMPFHVVQTIELSADALNIAFLGLNMREGLNVAR